MLVFLHLRHVRPSPCSAFAVFGAERFFMRRITGDHASIRLAEGSSALNNAASATTSQQVELRAGAVEMRLHLA
jgi:hypothetical protein